MHVLDYLEKLPETEEGKIFHYLHNLISTYPGMKSKVMFNTPFYTRNRWLCYLSSQKKGGIELCFVYANRFQQHFELLDFKKRKQVAGITYHNLKDIKEKVLDMLMKEALEVDERIKPKKKS